MDLDVGGTEAGVDKTDTTLRQTPPQDWGIYGEDDTKCPSKHATKYVISRMLIGYINSCFQVQHVSKVKAANHVSSLHVRNLQDTTSLIWFVDI